MNEQHNTEYITKQLNGLDENSLNEWNKADEELTKIFSKNILNKEFQKFIFEFLFHYFETNYVDRPKSSKYAFIKMMLMSKYSDIHVVAESVLDIWKLILKIYDNENTSLLDTFLPYLIDLYNISLTSHAVVTLLRNYSELDKLVTPIPMNKKSYAMLYVIITQHKQCNHFIQTLQKYQQNDQHRTDLFLLFIKEYLQIFISMNWCFSSKVLEELIQLISVLLQQDLQPSLLLSCFEIIHIVFTYPQYVVMNENVLKIVLNFYTQFNITISFLLFVLQ
ncbi:hypothetical protein QTN25_007193 [Entamoeba marina]